MTDEMQNPTPAPDSDGVVIKRWIIVHEPGLVPEKKRPDAQTPEGVLAFLRELIACRPEGTRYTVAELTWDHDMWVSDGHELLDIEAAMAGTDIEKPADA